MKQKITIVGGGACAMALGCALDAKKYDVSVYERNAAPGRKFLVAGDGGLNLTHSETPEQFMQRYTPPAFFEKAFAAFSNKDFVQWLNRLGVDTYVGSSGRVFPIKGIKPIEVLNVLLTKMRDNGVRVHTKHAWCGFEPGTSNLLFERDYERLVVESDMVIFCLGGASWPVTGSAGDWRLYFEQKNIKTLPFEASNCSFNVSWPMALLPLVEGKALKNITISCGRQQHAGEVVLTTKGLEGSGIYPLSPSIRQQLHAQGFATIAIDMKPTLSMDSLLQKLKKSVGKISYTSHVARQLNLTALQMNLLKQFVAKDDFLDHEKLVGHIKNLELKITGTGAIEDAISTVGGIALNEVDEHFELKQWPGHFAIGEMLNYDAPTGGYLLQSCFSMGHYLANYLNNRV